MTIKSERDIEQLVRSDVAMMRVLAAAESLHLPDWWIGAGFLRNRIWDYIAGNEPQMPRDVDLVYFNAVGTRPETDWAYDEQMRTAFPFADWEIRNQARMHYVNNFEPYTSTADSIAHWVETATCVAVKLDHSQLKFLFCYGTDDLLHLIARPVSYFRHGTLLETFHRRVYEKQWQERWPTLQVLNS